jgi:hypothetical protein
MKTLRRFSQHLAKFFLEWKMFQMKVVENTKTHILCSINFSRKSHRLWDNFEKCSWDQGATNVTIWRIRVARWISKAICTYAHAHAHAPGYPHARTHARTQEQACTRKPINNSYCSSTSTMVSWTRLNVTLYVHCLSCCLFFKRPGIALRQIPSNFYIWRKDQEIPWILWTPLVH